MRIRIVITCLLVVSWYMAGPLVTAGEPLVTFYAMGDVPYSEAEKSLLPRQIAEIPDDANFIVHLGDIKTGTTPCVEEVYTGVAATLRKSQSRVFVIPGDNEWNDCAQPAEAWKHWRKHLFQFDRHWRDGQAVARQQTLPENFAFVRNGVIFVGINLVGGRVHDAEEWRRRHAENVKWIKKIVGENRKGSIAMVLFGHANPAASHADFFRDFLPVAAEFKKPVLYLHGDGHRWIHDRPFGDAQNVLRVQVDQGGIAPPVRIQVRAGDMPFTFDRRK